MSILNGESGNGGKAKRAPQAARSKKKAAKKKAATGLSKASAVEERTVRTPAASVATGSNAGVKKRVLVKDSRKGLQSRKVAPAFAKARDTNGSSLKRPRVRRAQPERTGPERGWEHLYRGEHDTGGGPVKIAQRMVGDAYRVVDENLRAGREYAAKEAGRSAYTPNGAQPMGGASVWGIMGQVSEWIMGFAKSWPYSAGVGPGGSIPRPAWPSSVGNAPFVPNAQHPGESASSASKATSSLHPQGEPGYASSRPTRVSKGQAPNLKGDGFSCGNELVIKNLIAEGEALWSGHVWKGDKWQRVLVTLADR